MKDIMLKIELLFLNLIILGAFAAISYFFLFELYKLLDCMF